jgi:ribonuclease P protein subunit RPR2
MSQKIAEERIQRLFKLADSRISEDRESAGQLANRYVEIARKIGMKHNVSIPAELRKRYCHECFSFLKPGFNCQVRVNSKSSTLNYECKECGEVNRYGF